MCMQNLLIVLATLHLTPVTQKITPVTYLKALRLRRICDDDETFDKRSTEYQNYLIAREHKPSLVKQQFSEVRKKTRAEARQKQNRKEKVSDVKFITTYNPALPNINKIIKGNLSILHTDEKMKKYFHVIL